ncbi:MAG TPA: DUF4845 domain-containing protein [Xanthomonadales bacterium]|nr:DUF4845 domain-containing protein [Xanthomonadales bacterium]
MKDNRAAAPARGITLIGFVIVLAVVGFFAFMAMKLVPIYQEYMSVVSAMDALKTEAGIGNKSPPQIRDMLARRFDISYVESVKPENIKLSRSGEGYTLQIKYEVRKPFVYNIDIVVSFDRSVELSRFGGGVD